MRSAVDEILKFNRGFDPASLAIKRQRMAATPFALFRGTFHLFARDILDGPFRRWPAHSAAGQIVGDLHSENFGTYRSITGEIVYDINDFDETANSLYEYDLRRLLTGLLLAALSNQQPLSAAVAAAEACIHGYLNVLARLGKIRTRAEWVRLKDRKQVRAVLAAAGEKSRVAMMRNLAAESADGKFVLTAKNSYGPLSDSQRAEIVKAFPVYLKHVLAPPRALLRRYRLEDAAFRFAGCGSLGRNRYALLVGKAPGEIQTWEALRLIEWKDALDSAFDSARPRHSKSRAQQIFKATVAFQLLPKRYLGYVTVAGCPMQAREIGANDARFAPRAFAEPARFAQAAGIFGEITARAHLLSSLGKVGPRAFTHTLSGGAGKEGRYINRLLAFAVAYADRTHEDFEEFVRRQDEITKAWPALKQPVAK